MSSLFGFQSKEEKLFEAAKKGDTNTVKSLLEENTHIDVNYRDSYYDGYTALHYAASNGHREICELLISNSNIDINVKDNIGDTALHSAASNGHREICELFMSNSNIDISIETNKGYTASELALARGHNHLAHILSTEARWRMRRAYLSLVYGCPDAAGHIDRFLFDEMMCREVCSYMDVKQAP